MCLLTRCNDYRTSKSKKQAVKLACYKITKNYLKRLLANKKTGINATGHIIITAKIKQTNNSNLISISNRIGCFT